MIYFDQLLLVLFLFIVLLWLYIFRYDTKRLKYDLDYTPPNTSKFLIGVLEVLGVIFYGLATIYAIILYQFM